MLVEESSRVNFDSCQYKEIYNPENMMNEWNVIMSKPSSIEISKRSTNINYGLKDEQKTNKFKVINVKNNHKHKTRIKKYVKTGKVVKKQKGNKQYKIKQR